MSRSQEQMEGSTGQWTGTGEDNLKKIQNRTEQNKTQNQVIHAAQLLATKKTKAMIKFITPPTLQPPSPVNTHQ